MKKKSEPIINEVEGTVVTLKPQIAPLHVSGNEDFNQVVEKINEIINCLNK